MTNPAGTPAEGAYEETTFTVGGLPEYDNGTATVVIGWPDADPQADFPIDWDVEVFDSRGRPVASAATLDNPERATLIDPPPGTYTIRMTNYDRGDGSSELDRSRRVRLPDPGHVLRAQGIVEPHLQQPKRKGDQHPGSHRRPRQDRPHR